MKEMDNTRKMMHSLSSRISFWTVLVAATLLTLMEVQLWRGWERSIRAEVEKDAAQVLEATVRRVSNIMEDAEIAVDNSIWLIEKDIDHPDAMVTNAKLIVSNNEVLNSCSISFEPYFYKSKGRYYSVFAYRDSSGNIGWEQEGDDEYDYFTKTWYTLPKHLRQACWTEPYSDETTDQRSQIDTVLVSYCQPFYTRDKQYAGSLSVDLSLKWLSETMLSVKPYPNSYCVLIGNNGNFLVHPDRDKLYFSNFFLDGQTDADHFELSQSMMRGESGHREIIIDGERCFVFYQPMEATGWTVAIVCPEDDIYGDFNRAKNWMMIIILSFLLLLFFIIVFLIRKQIAPLSELAVNADYIASGNFNHPLAETSRKDEIGVLNHSFRNMQESLNRHIEELTEATASRERMKRELQIARNIQMGMVPHVFPDLDKLDLFASMTPAKEVGGDLYDFFIQNDKLYICIGDVSGKGIPASLIMAVTRGMFRILARQELSPEAIARGVNDTLAEENEEMLFVTMFFACINLKTGEMAFCNCGHNAPVLLPCNGEAPSFLDCKPNTVVGVMPGYQYEGQRINDIRGQALFLYTDGLNEAENIDHEQFGNDAMLAALGSVPFKDARTLVEQMREAVDRHVDIAEPSDDLTLFCVKLKA